MLSNSIFVSFVRKESCIMKYKKKARSFVAMLLALVMMVSMLPTTAFADAMTTDGQPGGVVIGDITVIAAVTPKKC